jgi:hypothetical protein
MRPEALEQQGFSEQQLGLAIWRLDGFRKAILSLNSSGRI